MDQVNPYAAPSAAVFDNASTPQLTLSQILFSFEGRIRRGQYWLYLIGSSLAYVIAVGALFGIFAVLAPKSSDTVIPILTMIAYLPWLWVGAAIQAKRWHDRDKSGWWMLLSFVPLANIWAGIELGFLAGTPGRNQYGAPPA